jgi:hypothetical protein
MGYPFMVKKINNSNDEIYFNLTLTVAGTMSFYESG